MAENNIFSVYFGILWLLALCIHLHCFKVFLHLCRDPGAEEKMNPFAEQEAWEEHQIGKDIFVFTRFYAYVVSNYTAGTFWIWFVDLAVVHIECVLTAGKATLKFGSKNKKQLHDDYQWVLQVSLCVVCKFLFAVHIVYRIICVIIVCHLKLSYHSYQVNFYMILIF